MMSSRYNHLATIANGVEDNRPGYGDYDVPRPARAIDGTQDYDMPLTKKEREAKERALGMLPPEASGASPKLVDRPGSDYAVPVTKEERERREKVLSASTTLLPPSSVSESSSLSGDSRPLSLASSTYSSDMNSVSSSSRSSSKMALPKEDEPEYSTVKKPSSKLKPQSSLEEQISALDQLVVDLDEQVVPDKTSEEELPSEMQSLGKVVSSARSSFSENGSSRSGSNDNLGVWDDVSYEDEESESPEEEGEGEEVVMAPVGGGDQRGSKEEVLLDNWIKELESGMKGMAEVAGMDVSEVVSA